MTKSFSKLFKELRTKNDLLQKDIAEDLGVERTTVVHWEAGRVEPNMDTLDRIAEYFNVTVDYLLGREELKQQITTQLKNDLMNENIDIYKKLSPEEQERVAHVVKALLNTYKKGK